MKIVEHNVAKGFDLFLVFLTWGLVSIYTFYLWYENNPSRVISPSENTLLQLTVAVLLIVFLIAVLVSKTMPAFRYLSLALQSMTLLVLLWLSPSSILLVLGVVWVAQFGDVVSIKKGLAIATLPPAAHLLFASHDYVVMNAGLYYMFNCFAFMVSHQRESERRAKNEQARLLRELRATQSLLDDTARRDERLRIARDLHDVMGHHLTALNLQLEIATHAPTPFAAIEKAKLINQTMLSDVRGAVSHFREQNSIHIHIEEAIKHLTHQTEGLDITLQVQDQLTITDTKLAETIIRVVQEAITNILRHSRASMCAIELSSDDKNLFLTIKDDGGQCPPFSPSNGITGMQERIAVHDGELHYHYKPSGVCLSITIPLEDSL